MSLTCKGKRGKEVVGFSTNKEKHRFIYPLGCLGFDGIILITNDIRANPVIPCGLRYMDPNEDVRDLSGGDCDIPNSDKCVFAESHIVLLGYKRRYG
jgi:hypothetical protein